MTQDYSYALKSTINEIKNVTPHFLSSFIFNKEGQIIAQDDATNEESAKQAINLFGEMTKSSSVIGELENISIQSDNGQVNFTCVEDFCLVIVCSKGADGKILRALSRVLVPTAINLVNQLSTMSPEKTTVQNNEPEIPSDVEQLPSQETTQNKPTTQEPLSNLDSEAFLPEAPVNQLIVEKLSGMLAPTDTVRINAKIIAGWNELYGNKKIQKVNLETVKMKTTQCKYKPIKDPNLASKGIIEIPEKILLTLDISKGELVMVKPVIE